MNIWKARPGSDGLLWFAVFVGAVSGFPCRWWFLYFSWKQERRESSEGQIVHRIWGNQVVWLCTNPDFSAALSGGGQGNLIKSWMWQNLLMSQHWDPAAFAWIFQLPRVLTFPFQVFSHCTRLEKGSMNRVCILCSTLLYSQTTQWVISV